MDIYNNQNKFYELLDNYNNLNNELKLCIQKIKKSSFYSKKQTILDFHNNNYKKIINEMEKMCYDDPDDLIKNL